MCIISIMDNFGNNFPTKGGIPFTENDGQERQNRKMFYTRPKSHLTVLNEREENEYNFQAQERPVLQPTHNELRLPPLKTAIPFRMSEHPNGTLNSGINNPHQKSTVAYVPETWTPENVARVKQEQLIAFNKTKDKSTFLEKMSSRIRGTKIKRAATAITECAQYSYPKWSAIANICNNGISQNREYSGKQSLPGETFRLPKICTNESRQTNSVASSHLHGSGNHNKITSSNKVTKLPLLEDKTCNKYSNGANVGQASHQFIDSICRRPDTPAPHSRNAGTISNNFLHPRGGFKDNLREMMAVRKSDNLRGTNKSDTRAVSSARKPKNAPWTELNKKSLEINLVETGQDYNFVSNKEKFRSSEHQIAEDYHHKFSDTITKFSRFSPKLRKNLNAMIPKIALP